MAVFDLGVVLVRWNQPAPGGHLPPWYAGYYGDHRRPGVARFWWSQSSRRLELRARVVGWLELHATRADLGTPATLSFPREKVGARALAQVRSPGWAAAGYDGIVIIPDLVTPAGWTLDAGAFDLDVPVSTPLGTFRVRRPAAVIPPGAAFDFAAHEIGHVLGLDHSFGLDSYVRPDTHVGEYGHPCCVMSAQSYGGCAPTADPTGTPSVVAELQERPPGLDAAIRHARGWAAAIDVDLERERGLDTLYAIASLGSPGDGVLRQLIRLRVGRGPSWTVALRSPADEFDAGLLCPMLVISAQRGSTAEAVHPGGSGATYLGEIHWPEPRRFAAPAFHVELSYVSVDGRRALVRIVETLRQWGGWAPLRPELRFDARSPVTALARRPGHLDVFRVGRDGAVRSTWFHDEGGGWRPWYAVQPSTVFAPEASVSAVARRADHVDLFTTGLDGAVWSTWLSERDRTWRPWFQIHPQTVFRQDRPVVALGRRPEQLDLFRIGFDGALWSSWWTPATGWHPWFQIRPEIRFSSDARVSALARRPDHIDVFVVGNDGAVWSTWVHDDGRGWQPWYTVRPEVRFAADRQVAAVARMREHIDLFVVGLDGALWSTWWSPTTGWRAWYTIRPGTRFPASSCAVAIGRRPDHLDVFVVGHDGRVWSTWYHDDGRGWRPWFRIDDRASFGNAHPVAARARNPETIDLFAAGSDDAVWTARWPGEWRPTLPPTVSVPIYAVRTDGRLDWYRHDGRHHASKGWTLRERAGTSWHAFSRVFGNDDGVVYAVRADGVLLWYRHEGRLEGAFRWQGPSEVGSSWQQFRYVVGNGDGHVYAVRNDGVLLWYRHDGRTDGTDRWQGAREVGTSWSQFDRVVGGGNGILYAIRPDGTMLWYRHEGREDGRRLWSGHTIVGRGWNQFIDVFADREGVLYALRPSGELLWYRHDGRHDGSFRWSGPKVVGTGWHVFRHLFSG